MKPEEAIEIIWEKHMDCEDYHLQFDSYPNGYDFGFDQAILIAAQALEEVQQYREIGTVEECRKAVEKQKAKKPVKDKYHHNCCPNCGWIVSGEGGYGEEFCPHCENCGQAIRWDENLEETENEQIKFGVLL